MRRTDVLYKVEQKRQNQMLLMFAVSVLLAGVFSLGAGAGEAQAQATFTCDKWASTNGSDANAGTKENPVQTVRTLAYKLQPGQTGCLTAGETFHMESGSGIIQKSGLAGSPITIRSAPEGKANLTGQMRVDGDYLDIKDLNFKGLAAVGDTYPKTNHIHVVGDDISLINNDITSPKGICVSVGTIASYLPEDHPDQTANSAKNFKLDGNKIYGCGVETYLDPTKDSGMHGVYLAYTEDAKITNNYIYDNRVRGLQLYSRAERTLVEYNVLDGNSGNLNIGGSSHEGGYFVSRDTTVRNNIISNSTFKYPKDTAQVFGNYKAGVANTEYNNVITENCVYHQDPTKNFGGSGYNQTNNKINDPLYKDRTNKDFTLAAGSPCAGKGPQSTDGGGGQNTAPEITNMSPIDGSTTTNRRPTMSATVRDAETDLQKSDVKIYIDGTLISSNHYGYSPANDYLWREFEAEDLDFSYGTHTVRVVATDAQGIFTERNWNFEVTEANDAPTITSVKPTSGQTSGVLRNANVTATFSEEMNSGTLTTADTLASSTSAVNLYQKHWYQVRKKKGKKIRRVWTYRWVEVSASVGCDTPCKTAELDPYYDLAANTDYWAIVTTGAKDKSGNALAENYSWTFTTGST